MSGQDRTAATTVRQQARELAEAVKDFAEDAPQEWDGGNNLGYAVGAMHELATELLATLNQEVPRESE